MPDPESRNRPDVYEMDVVHRVFRREAAMLPRLVLAVRDGDRARAASVAEHIHLYRDGLHEHHTGEDDLIWPLLLARVDLEKDLVLRMEDQHQVLAGTLAEIDRTLPGWVAAPSRPTAQPVAEALARHQEALHEHLRDEEDLVVPLIEEYLTVEEWNRLSERFIEAIPKDKLLLFLGAMLEELDDTEREKMMGSLPRIARVVWWAIGSRRYARYVHQLREPLSA